MAAIVKRGNKYSVVFNYTDENGVTRQKWESPVNTKKEAQKRKNEIEHELATGTFIAPSAKKVRDFLVEFVEMYGLRKWGLSMYTSNTGLIRNYINPILGDVNVQDVDARVVDRFISTLQKTKAVECNGRKPKTEFVTPCTIEKIIKLMRCAFERAVRWGMVGKILSSVQRSLRGNRRNVPYGMHRPSVRLWMPARTIDCSLPSILLLPVLFALGRSVGLPGTALTSQMLRS